MLLRVVLYTFILGAISSVYAGALDRSKQQITPLFAKGQIFEYSQAFVSPDVEGRDSLNQPTGNVADDYFLLSAAYKTDLGQSWALAFIVDQPWGVDIEYGRSSPLYGGTSVEVDTLAITSLLQYRLANGLSFYGGPRLQQFKGNVVFSGLGFGSLAGYTLNTNRDWEWGYALGVAYELPAYAARVDLTYSSEIIHDLQTDESISTASTSAPLNTPMSVNINFRTGISPTTLLFGSIRWVEWSDFDFKPEALGFSITTYDENIVSYSLGLGRRFSPAWSGALILQHEPKSDHSNSLLRPTNGYSSIVFSGTYTTKSQLKITAAVNYRQLGDAGAMTAGGNSVRFSNNDSIAVGFKVSVPL